MRAGYVAAMIRAMRWHRLALLLALAGCTGDPAPARSSAASRSWCVQPAGRGHAPAQACVGGRLHHRGRRRRAARPARAAGRRRHRRRDASRCPGPAAYEGEVPLTRTRPNGASCPPVCVNGTARARRGAAGRSSRSRQGTPRRRRVRRHPTTRRPRGDDGSRSSAQAYAVEGPALELGAVVLDGQAAPRGAGADAAVDAQPARAGRRRDRHRQDQDAAAHGRADVGRPASRSSSPTSRATSPGSARPGRATASGSASAPTETGDGLDADRLPGRVPRARRARATGVPVRATMTSFGPVLLSKVLGLNDTQESSLGPGLPLRRQGGPAAARPQGPARGHHPPHQRRGQGRPRGARRAVQGDRRRHPARADRARARRRRRLLRRAGVRHGRPAAHDARTAGACCRSWGSPAVQDKPRAVQHLPDVAAGRPVPRPARGRRRRASPSSSSSSTRPTCCSTTPARRSSTRSPARSG